ncbi:hypothetical protein [Methanoplanus endosymbiosus]|uniref:Zinc-ribbon domain-containing protein n=1 Tax=Methanoplanus endosymbiosus TaxID=33865 RepID=A0A9E7PLG0_9EURY|nr:hypothetical protein [Methanoplanus endosymbiosus]UUX91517.1 hypothetical protein L6E24_09045 [Methanoplanus endosymbiosus]
MDFDAFLTDKRIIFAKKGDELYERKELVFPLGFIKDYTPSADEKGIPRIIFSVQKPDGDKGDMILVFTQTGDYRFAERDDWIEKLGRMIEKEPAAAVTAPPTVQRAAMSSDPFAPTNTQQSAPQMPAGYAPEPHIAPPVQTDIHTQRPESHMTAGYAPEPQAAPPVQTSSPPQNSVTGQFCRFCGSNIPTDSAFCPSCGGKVVPVAARSAPPAPAQIPVPPPPPSRPAYPDDAGRQAGGFVPPPPPPPQRQAGFPEENYRAPPAPSGGGYAPADEPGHRNYEESSQTSKGRKKPDRIDKAALREEKRAEKERKKEEARYRKEQKKANKNAGRDQYDDYDGDGRMGGKLPKILIPAIIAVVVIGVVAYAFTSGMFGGSGGGAEVPVTGTGSTLTDNTNTGSSSGTTSSGTSQSTADYDKGWEVRVIYSGEWAGTFGSGSNMQNEEGFGSQTFAITSPSGSITATFEKADGGAGQIMFVDIMKDSKVMATGDTTADNGKVTVTASL